MFERSNALVVIHVAARGDLIAHAGNTLFVTAPHMRETNRDLKADGPGAMKCDNSADADALKFDVGDGYKHRTASCGTRALGSTTGSGDGVLAIDADGDGALPRRSGYASIRCTGEHWSL